MKVVKVDKNPLEQNPRIRELDHGDTFLLYGHVYVKIHDTTLGGKEYPCFALADAYVYGMDGDYRVDELVDVEVHWSKK